MREISIREVRSELAHIEKVLDREGELIVTRNGRPVARILPLRGGRSAPSHARLRASMPRLEPSSAELIRQERDERG
jgi:prevent-host-death family protein